MGEEGEMMKPLNERTVPELQNAIQHIDSLTSFVQEQSAKNPGLGWNVVVDMLTHDRCVVEKEIQRRLTVANQQA